jgi:hypothetical protein
MAAVRALLGEVGMKLMDDVEKSLFPRREN